MMAISQGIYEIIRSHAILEKMCYIQNIHTCQCLGKLEPAFTPQDVRSCTCPMIVRMHGLRHKCEPCRRQHKRGKKKNTRRTDSSDASMHIPSGKPTSREATAVERQQSAVVSNDSHAQPADGGQTQCHTIYSSPLEASEKQEVVRSKFDIFTSSSWNAGRPHGTPRVGRLLISGEVDVVNMDQGHQKQAIGQAKQQIIDQIEELFGQLSGMKLAGLVFQTMIV